MIIEIKGRKFDHKKTYGKIIKILNDQHEGICIEIKSLNKGRELKKYKKRYDGLHGNLLVRDDGSWLVKIEKTVSERTKIRFFLHEMLHIAYENLCENIIERLELKMWRLFSEKQKQMLKIYMYKLARKK